MSLKDKIETEKNDVEDILIDMGPTALKLQNRIKNETLSDEEKEKLEDELIDMGPKALKIVNTVKQLDKMLTILDQLEKKKR